MSTIDRRRFNAMVRTQLDARWIFICGHVDSSSRDTAAMESEFRQNGWPPQWRNGVYNFQHHHSTAH